MIWRTAGDKTTPDQVISISGWLALSIAHGIVNFTTGRTHRLRLTDPSSSGSPIIFSIDNPTMTDIANDFVPVVGKLDFMASRLWGPVSCEKLLSGVRLSNSFHKRRKWSRLG